MMKPIFPVATNLAQTTGVNQAMENFRPADIMIAEDSRSLFQEI